MIINQREIELEPIIRFLILKFYRMSVRWCIHYGRYASLETLSKELGLIIHNNGQVIRIFGKEEVKYNEFIEKIRLINEPFGVRGGSICK